MSKVVEKMLSSSSSQVPSSERPYAEAAAFACSRHTGVGIKQRRHCCACCRTFMPLLIAVKSLCSVCWTSAPLSTALTTTFSSNDSSSRSVFAETRWRGLDRSSWTLPACRLQRSRRLSWSSCLEYRNRRALFSARCCFCYTLRSCLTSSRVPALSTTRTPMILKCRPTSVRRPLRHRPLLSVSLRA